MRIVCNLSQICDSDSITEHTGNNVIESIMMVRHGPTSTSSPFYLSKFFERKGSYWALLKATCQEHIKRHYAKELSPHIDCGHNQLEYFALIDQNIEQLLLHGFFLRGGPNENVIISDSYDVMLSYFSLGSNCLLWKSTHCRNL